MSILKFGLEESVKVTLDYDSGQRVDGDYGTQFKFGCNNGEDMFYATPTLATLIDQTTGGEGKAMELLIKKTIKVDKDGKEIPIFTVNGKSMDDLSLPNPVIANSPVGAGFAHKDNKLSLLEVAKMLSEHEYRIRQLEGIIERMMLGESEEAGEILAENKERVKARAEAELPF